MNCAVENVSRIFSERLFIEIPANDADLIESGVLDSLTLVDLLVHLEQEFGIHVVMDELELDDFRTLERIADFVVRSRQRVNPQQHES